MGRGARPRVSPQGHGSDHTYVAESHVRDGRAVYRGAQKRVWGLDTILFTNWSRDYIRVGVYKRQ